MQLPAGAPPPRLCVIQKESPSQEYGYNLHAEKSRGQFVGVVDKGSPADQGGLRKGDRIFAVNGHSIIGESHKKVVERIKETPMRCEMLVISEEGARWYADQNIPVTLQLPNIVNGSEQNSSRRQTANGGSPPPAAGWYAPSNGGPDPVFVAPPPPQDDMSSLRPRICKLEKSSPTDEFGFNLHAEKGRGHFIGTVDTGGIGDLAGLRMGQRIVGVNGELVYPTTPHKDVVSLIKKSSVSTTLLVASEEVDAWYREHNSPFSFENAELGAVETQLSPHSIQITDEEEDNKSHSYSKTEVYVHEESRSHSGTEQSSVYFHNEQHQHTEEWKPEQTLSYDLPAVETQIERSYNDNDDIMNAVFAGVQAQDHVVEEPQEHHSYDRAPSSVGSPEPQENAVDVHDYQPAYNAYSSESAILSNGSLNGQNHYHHQEHDDIFHLSAKEARERLRAQRVPRRPLDMSLDEKYRLVSNM